MGDFTVRAAWSTCDETARLQNTFQPRRHHLCVKTSRFLLSPPPESDRPSRFTHLRKPYSSMQEPRGECEIYRMTVFQQQIQQQEDSSQCCVYKAHSCTTAGVSPLKQMDQMLLRNTFLSEPHVKEYSLYSRYEELSHSVWGSVQFYFAAAGTKLATAQIVAHKWESGSS